MPLQQQRFIRHVVVGVDNIVYVDCLIAADMSMGVEAFFCRMGLTCGDNFPTLTGLMMPTRASSCCICMTPSHIARRRDRIPGWFI